MSDFLRRMLVSALGSTRWRRVGVAATLLTGWLVKPGAAGEPAPRVGSGDPLPPNVESLTLGGWQYWGDEVVFHDWRIQRHVSTAHYRLLDDKNVRQCWGTLEQCQAKLDEIKQGKQSPPMKGRVVLLLHGMIRTRASMEKMATALAQDGSCEALCIGYPSTRAGVGYHARALNSILSNLGPEVTAIDLVGHSLGNLVIRHYFGDRLASESKKPDPRVRRIVMLGPPNHAPQRARLWTESSQAFRGLYQFALADTGNELAEGFAQLEPKLATPTCEFGIIAGGRGDDKGWHPGLPGDDDTTVTVEETRLAGASDFAVLPAIHTFLMTDDRIIDCTRRFLTEGYFLSPRQRQPIPAGEPWPRQPAPKAPAPDVAAKPAASPEPPKQDN